MASATAHLKAQASSEKEHKVDHKRVEHAAQETHIELVVGEELVARAGLVELGDLDGRAVRHILLKDADGKHRERREDDVVDGDERGIVQGL
jgi:hypothetical protein